MPGVEPSRERSDPATHRPESARFFGERADWYDRGYDAASPDGHVVRARMETALRVLGPGPGSVLDAGMGPGRLCAALESAGWTVSGVDAAEEMVEAARVRVPSAAGRFVRGEIESLPFPSDSFDSVTATGILEYADIPRALAEIRRVLAPGGRAVISYPNPRAYSVLWKTRVWYPAVRAGKRLLRRPHAWLPRGAGGGPLTPSAFNEKLRAAGLEPLEIEHCGYLVLVPPLELLMPRLAARLGRSIEGRAPTWLATQVIYVARKPTA